MDNGWAEEDDVLPRGDEHADTIAERMRALLPVPDGRPETITASTALPRQAPGEQDSAPPSSMR